MFDRIAKNQPFSDRSHFMDNTNQPLINYAALESADVSQEPFPYLMIPNFLIQETIQPLIEHFPQISHRGSLPVSSIQTESIFTELTKELLGPTLRALIAKKFEIDLQDKPTMLTMRGNTHERDGAIHTDSKSKLITLLLYMNPSWDTEEGKLRLLKNKHSLDDYVAEVSPLVGSCLIFKVTPNCWHGHKPFVGKRLSLQLNYLVNDAALTKHLNHHRFTAWLKRLFPKMFPQHTTETY